MINNIIAIIIHKIAFINLLNYSFFILPVRISEMMSIIDKIEIIINEEVL